MKTAKTFSGGRLVLWVIGSLLLLSSAILASKTFEPVFTPELDVSRAKEAVKVDGHLNDRAWRNASKAVNFVERSPGDKTKPAVETEAYITYDDDHLYVAFFCYDNPADIRATMCQRDQFSGDDAVAVMIDTYGDASWAYEFLVNPYGVQKDRLWSSIAGEDAGFDLIWHSAAQITDSGYQVEIAVPFSSMRFPNKDVQNWRIDFWRDRPRESYNQYSWAAYNRDDQCWVCQWGTIQGIRDVQPGKGLEILPSIIGNQSGALSNYGTADESFDESDIDGEISLGAKYSISSDLTLEATYNPDFSQIEADAAQIDVNSTIALFYPERRPFFQEGSDIFRTLFNSFYTRTVNDPQFAAKLTGRVNGTSIGFLSALDENTPYMIPMDEQSFILNSGKSVTNVLRGTRSVGDDSQLGFIVSDRRFDGGGSGTILALDGDISLSRTLSIDGQFIASHTAEPDDSAATEGLENVLLDDDGTNAAFDGESYWGNALIARIRRNARAWDFTIDYNQVSETYRTQVGYDPLSDYRNYSVWNSYTVYPEKGLLERINPQLYIARREGFDGTKRWVDVNLSLNNQLRYAQTYVNVSYHTRSEIFRSVEFDDLWDVDLFMGSRLSEKIGYNLHLEYGRGVARNFMVTGDETSAELSLNLKPMDRIIIEPDLSFYKSKDAETGEELYDGYIMRTRLRYQANKELSLRLVVQYDDFYQRWDIDPLLTYRLSSFSVFYLGSTYDYGNMVDPADREEWKLTSRQFFLKLQYLFQT